MIGPLIEFATGLLGPKYAKFAGPLVAAVLFLLALGFVGLGKCAYDRSVIQQHEQKIEQRAKPATDAAANQRAQDTINNAKNEEDMHNVIAAQPDQPISPTSRAHACEQLRRAGRHSAACSGPAGGH